MPTFFFSATEPSYGISSDSVLPLYHLIKTLIAQLVVNATLHYCEQILHVRPSRFVVILDTAV